MNENEGGSGCGLIWGSSQVFTLRNRRKSRKCRSRLLVSRPRLEPCTTSLQVRNVNTWEQLRSENHYDHYATESRECVDTYLHIPLRLCRMVLMHRRIVSTICVYATVDGTRAACVSAPTASCTVHLAGHLLICPQYHMPTVTTYGTQNTGP